MSYISELVKEAQEGCLCRVEKEGELYRVLATEVSMLQDFIGWIEVEGYKARIHGGPEQVEDTALYGLLVDFVRDDELPEEERGEYTVVW